MTSYMYNSESFFDYNFKTSAPAKDNFQDDASESDYGELDEHVYFERRKRLRPLTDKLRKWQRNIRATVGRLREYRGSTEEDSRATSAMSFNSSLSGRRSSTPVLEVIDFIDDEYLSIRRRVRLYHNHLGRVFEHLDSAFKRGPPLGGRLDALKSTFKSGSVGQFPEEALAKCLAEFCLDLPSNGKLALSLREASDAFNSSASLRQALVKEARFGFLAPLTEFLTRDWKEICAKDKSLRQLAKKIQKAKIEAKLSQSEINGMMSQFAVRRDDVVSNFEYILRSEIPLTKRLINLMEAYKLYYFENTKLFNGLERSLRMHLGQAPPDKISFDGATCQPEGEELPREIPSTSTGVDEADLQCDDSEDSTTEASPIIDDGKSGVINGIGNGDGAGVTMANLLLPGDSDSAKKAIWAERNLKLIQEAPAPSVYRSAARAYGFVRTAYRASGGDELNLAVGDLVFLDAKLEHAETKRIWVCGEVSSGAEKRAGLFPLDTIEVIIDL